MPPRTSAGGPSPSKGKATQAAPELNETPARFDLPRESAEAKLALAPLDQKKDVYQPGTPIKFYDEEVKRMHSAIDEKAESERRAARRSLRQPPRPRKRVTLTGFFARVTVLYLAIAYFLVCPNDSSRDRAVCRGLDRFSTTLYSYEPTARPYYRAVEKMVDPYVRRTKEYTRPYVAKAKPYYSRVDKTVSPRVKQAYQFYLRAIYPRLVAAVRSVRSRTRPFAQKVEKGYRKTLAPSVDWYSKSGRKWYSARVEPSLQKTFANARRTSQRVKDAVSPVYSRGIPLAKHHYRANLVPFAQSAYSTSRDTYTSHVHPQLAVVSSHAQHLYKTKVSPSLLRFWSKFIAPQLDKIRERIFEFKAKEARVAAMKRVDKVSDEIAHEHGEEDFEDFVKELHDDTYVGETASPVVVEAEDVAAPPSYTSSVPPPPSPEEQAAATAEKRAALELLQSTYEREISSLGRTEQRLLVKRLADIRRQALEDLPARFDVVLEGLDEEGDKMVGKLGRYFTKVSGEDKASVEDKVEHSRKLSEKAQLRVEKKQRKVEEEIEKYRFDLKAKEDSAVDEAQKSVTALVAKAQEELGFGFTWLDDVTHKDWQRYHGLAVAEENLHKSFSDLQSGEIRDSTLSSLDPNALLDDYAKQPKSLVAAFSTILAKITLKGQKELKGEWTGVSNEAQKVLEVVEDKLVAAVDSVKEQASSVVGIKSEPSNIRETMAALAASAQSSASSLANALPTIKTPHSVSDLRNSAGFIVSEAQHRAAEAYAQAAKQGSKLAGVEDTKGRANEYFGDASQAVVRAFGGEPDPTNLRQSATSLAGAASSALSKASDVASSLVQPHSDFPTSVPVPTAFSGGGIKASLESLASSASSALHDATRTTAEGIVETASSLASAAQASLNALGSPHPSYSKSTAAASVRSIVEEASSTVSSATSQAKSIAHEATASVKSALHVEL